MLTDGGRVVFESRNPIVRPWDDWTLTGSIEMTAPDGSTVQYSRAVHAVVGDRVHFTQTYASPKWEEPKVSHSTLRFLSAGSVAAFLSGAGLGVESRFGDWDSSPFTETSPEIITIAGRAPSTSRR
ncbi:MAG TPA: hypothetical protein VIX84_11190 [Acidimicrobiales bacterium]